MVEEDFPTKKLFLQSSFDPQQLISTPFVMHEKFWHKGPLGTAIYLTDFLSKSSLNFAKGEGVETWNEIVICETLTGNEYK